MQLAPGEHIVCKVQKHWIDLVFPLILSIFFIGIPIFIYRFIKHSVEEVVLTNRQFYVRTGIISRQVTTIPLRKINAVNYDEGFLGRFLGYGTIYIQSGVSEGGTGYDHISNPEKVKTMIEHTIEAAETK